MVDLGGEGPFHLVGSSGTVDGGETHVDLLAPLTCPPPTWWHGLSRPMTRLPHPPTQNLETVRQDKRVTRPVRKYGVDRPKLAAAPEGKERKL